MHAEYKAIEGYEGLYEVSSCGDIKSLIKNKVMHPTDNGNGYLIVSLHKDGRRKNHYVHRLVAQAFIPNPEGYKVINHKDYDTKNNTASNLEWCTQAYNIEHSAPHRKRFKRSTTNTGEQYITYRSSKERYRVIIGQKEYGALKTLEEAVQIRDRVLKELRAV